MSAKNIFVFVFSLFLQFSFAQENFDLTEKDTIVIGYSINPPFIYKNNDKLVGLSYWMWEELIKEETTIYKYRELPLDSLLNGLKKGTIDLVISPLTITSERNDYIMFTYPYYISNSTFMVHAITNKERFLTILSSVFSWSFFKILLTLFLLLFVFGVLVWYFERKKNSEEFSSDSRGIWHGLWWSAVTMTTVGYGDKSPKTVGGRVIGLIWMFAGLILISSVTASITSSLTVDKLTYTVDDIHNFRKKNIGTVNNSATETWLTNHFFSNVKTYESFEELIHGFRENEIDMVAYDEPLLQFTVQNEPNENWTILNISFNESMYGFGASKQLPLKRRDEVNEKLLHLKETDKWNQLLVEYDLDK
ncbi:transporter substrate-binding domain-containing protein [Namhaeicola litoreus]|uniref:Transporter substrate-binding domain-containing protein n=1 Tax=Namhaeicola litoreus TaxID=1052145 RepID=A0ABW3Y3E5_9FLAO